MQLHILRQLRLQLGQQRTHAIDGGNHVGVGLARDQNDHGGLAVEQAQRVAVFHAVAHFGHVLQPDRCAVAPSDDQPAVVGGFQAAAGGVGARINLQALAVALNRAFGAVRVAGLQGGAHVFHADAVAVQRKRQQLDAHGGQRAAAQLDIADAGHLGDFLLHQIGDFVVNLARRAGFRGQRQDDDGRGGWIGLAVSRVAAQRGGQVGAGGVDGGLHFSSGGVNLAVQVELQADAGRAGAAGRSHFVDPGNHAQAALQRRGDAAGHRVGAGAGQRGVDRNRRVIDLRQRRHRQPQKRHDARQRQPDGQQNRRDGTAHKGFGQVHGWRLSRRPSRSKAK